MVAQAHFEPAQRATETLSGCERLLCQFSCLLQQRCAARIIGVSRGNSRIELCLCVAACLCGLALKLLDFGTALFLDLMHAVLGMLRCTVQLGLCLVHTRLQLR